MTDVAPQGTPPAGTPPAGTPWHQGVEAEILGHWQNKGWKMDDPKEIALQATKQAREAEKYFGVPAAQLLKMPGATATEADQKAFWGKLGVPDDPKAYEFKNVTDKDKIDTAFLDTMRSAFMQARVSKDNADLVINAVSKYMADDDARQVADHNAKLEEQAAALRKNWGEHAAANMVVADNGAAKLGVNSDEVKAIGKVIGVDRAAELFRKIGAGLIEDKHVGGGPINFPTTQEGAVARKAELMADKAWASRLLAGDVTTVREWNTLERQISGYVEGT